MSYKINYITGKKIVKINIQGRLNFGIVQQYSLEAIKLAHEYNCKKYLINHTKSLLEGGIYKLHADGDALEQFGFKSNDKIAIVISSSQNDDHFLKTAKSNVKWSNFRYFSTVEKASQWLLEDKSIAS